MNNTDNQEPSNVSYKDGDPLNVSQRNASTILSMNRTSVCQDQRAQLAVLGSPSAMEEQSGPSNSPILASSQAPLRLIETHDAIHPRLIDTQSSPSTSAPKTLVKANKITSTDKWGTIQNLSDLQRSRDLAQLFLDVSLAEKILTGELNPNPALPQPSPMGHVSVGAIERLVHICLMSKMAKQNSTLMTVRWLFLLLLVGDIANTLAPKFSSLQERIQAYIAEEDSRKGKSRVDNPAGPKHLMFVDMDAEDTEDIVGMGRTLAFICDTFGAGCIFYLWEYFTENFLRFRVTRRGTHFKSAQANLARLCLQQKIEADGSQALAMSVRERMWTMYGVHGDTRGLDNGVANHGVLGTENGDGEEPGNVDGKEVGRGEGNIGTASREGGGHAGKAGNDGKDEDEREREDEGQSVLGQAGWMRGFGLF